MSWTCQRQENRKKCGMVNPDRKRLCILCGKPKRPKRAPAHREVLAMPYEWWTERFGKTCNICGAKPSPGRRLDRDHDHRTGEARGLLCHRHNRGLDWFKSLDELRAAVLYLERVADPRRRTP